MRRYTSSKVRSSGCALLELPPGRAPPRHAHGDLTSLAPQERLPELPLYLVSNTTLEPQLENTHETPQSSNRHSVHGQALGPQPPAHNLVEA